MERFVGKLRRTVISRLMLVPRADVSNGISTRARKRERGPTRRGPVNRIGPRLIVTDTVIRTGTGIHRRARQGYRRAVGSQRTAVYNQMHGCLLCSTMIVGRRHSREIGDWSRACDVKWRCTSSDGHFDSASARNIK